MARLSGSKSEILYKVSTQDPVQSKNERNALHRVSTKEDRRSRGDIDG